MITFNYFFTGSMNTVDGVIVDFVHKAYVHFIQANTIIITLLFTFYVMLLGYQFMHHHHHFKIWDVIKRIILMLCVYGLVMNWQLYHLFVYNIFTNEPANISHALVGAGSNSISAALDGIFEAVVNATLGLFGEVSFSATGLTFVLYGVLVYLIGTLMCVYALLLFIYAKMMMAVSLALGPIFLLFIMWEPTRGLFNAWLNKLITIALIPIITSAILVLMLSVINVTLPHLMQPVESMQFVGIIPFLGLCLTTILILSQVLRISSSLGGGIALASLSSGAAMVTSTWNKLDVPKRVQDISNLGSRRSTFIYRDRGAS